MRFILIGWSSRSTRAALQTLFVLAHEFRAQSPAPCANPRCKALLASSELGSIIAAAIWDESSTMRSVIPV